MGSVVKHPRGSDAPRLDLAQAYGEIARELREQHGKRQREVADALGIARPNCSRSEQGRHTPTAEVFLRLARFYGLEDHQVFRLVVERARARAEGIAS
jgi:transcriptional regulator with XRE-family HTH domain